MKRFEKYGTTTYMLLGRDHDKQHALRTTLTTKQKYELITLFFESYFNTDQEIEEFSTEFYLVVDAIYKEVVPLSADNLLVEGVYDKIIDILEDK